MLALGALLISAFPVHSFFFVRHGETMANASGSYNARSLNAFSAKGEREVQTLTDELVRAPRFELILVSPSPRAMKTIAPYLIKTRQRALIWPLLYECCTGKRPPHASPSKFGYGPEISIPPDLKPYFAEIPRETKLPNALTYSQGLAQVDAAVKEFDRLYRGKRVLLVGHSGQGGHFIHELTGKWIQLKNAEIHEIPLD